MVLITVQKCGEMGLDLSRGAETDYNLFLFMSRSNVSLTKVHFVIFGV